VVLAAVTVLPVGTASAFPAPADPTSRPSSVHRPADDEDVVEAGGLVEVVPREDAAAKVKCYSKAATKGIGVDGTCLTKASDKFAASWAKLEEPGNDCLTTGDATDIVRLTRWFEEGRLKLRELVNRTYTLNQIDAALDALATSAGARGVISSVK